MKDSNRLHISLIFGLKSFIIPLVVVYKKGLSFVMQGKVKKFNKEKGYGFITADTGDVFFHYSQIEMEGYKTVDEGEEVEFELIEGDRGPQAHHIKRIAA